MPTFSHVLPPCRSSLPHGPLGLPLSSQPRSSPPAPSKRQQVPAINAQAAAHTSGSKRCTRMRLRPKSPSALSPSDHSPSDLTTTRRWLGCAQAHRMLPRLQAMLLLLQTMRYHCPCQPRLPLWPLQQQLLLLRQHRLPLLPWRAPSCYHHPHQQASRASTSAVSHRGLWPPCQGHARASKSGRAWERAGAGARPASSLPLCKSQGSSRASKSG